MGRKICFIQGLNFYRDGELKVQMLEYFTETNTRNRYWWSIFVKYAIKCYRTDQSGLRSFFKEGAMLDIFELQKFETSSEIIYNL